MARIDVERSNSQQTCQQYERTEHQIQGKAKEILNSISKQGKLLKQKNHQKHPKTILIWCTTITGQSIAPSGRTILTARFIQSNKVATLQHLRRVSDYIVEGEGVWYTEVDKNIIFHDGADDTTDHEKPALYHFR